MLNKFGYLALVCGLVIAPAAISQSASDRVTQLEAETMVLKARERQLEVQANIIAKQQEIMLKQLAADRMTNNPSNGDPIVRSVESIGKTTYATFELANGYLLDAKVGDELPNGMKILAINPTEVTIERNGKRSRLTGASQEPAPFNPSYPNVDLGLTPSSTTSSHAAGNTLGKNAPAARSTKMPPNIGQTMMVTPSAGVQR